MVGEDDHKTVTVLCPKLVIGSGLQWLIGSPFFPSLTIISTFNCVHTTQQQSASPDYSKESDALRSFLIRGFVVIGALVTGSTDVKLLAGKAADAARKLRKELSDYNCGGKIDSQEVIGAVVDSNSGDVHFFVSKSENGALESVIDVVYEEHPEKYVWETGCLLRCELPIKLPIYYPVKSSTDAENIYLRATEAAIEKLKKRQVVYMIEASSRISTEVIPPVIIRNSDLDFQTDILEVKCWSEGMQNSKTKFVPCAHFCSKSKASIPVYSVENADTLQVKVLMNRSEISPNATAPIAEYFPALEKTRVLCTDLILEVLCYAVKDLPLESAVSNLIIPGIVDQLRTMKNAILPILLTHPSHLRPYHFSPPGCLHPITVIYDLNYGETEMNQVEARRLLHLRLGLPGDRPLLRIANALDLSSVKHDAKSNLRKGTPLLKDVHTEIPSSGVSGGLASLIQGSYLYHHYLQDGFDDSGWGCAYRSLQTIISWFKLQHYTSIDVPSHREIQQALVVIGDKDPSFIGSREWIGAIELSFVLDKLLGVSCKVMNVRSGAELPERCRELAMHFEIQGTPIMIGGGVLAYTLLGVDYNEASGDCAFLILDPHYTGNDELKKVVNGGWCGWKKAVDSKGKRFFLEDKFYNLLLPQRPNKV